MVGDGRAASFAAEGLVEPNSDPCGARGNNHRPTRRLAWTHSKKIADLFARRGTLQVCGNQLEGEGLPKEIGSDGNRGLSQCRDVRRHATHRGNWHSSRTVVLVDGVASDRTSTILLRLLPLQGH
jgi:hypothetical protein